MKNDYFIRIESPGMEGNVVERLLSMSLSAIAGSIKDVTGQPCKMIFMKMPTSEPVEQEIQK